jgi:prophage maintenance system killer protein
MVAVTFLELNGMVFTATEESVVEHTLGLASGGINEPKYAAWLKAHSKRA